MISFLKKNWQPMLANLFVVVIAICIAKKLGLLDLKIFDADRDYEEYIDAEADEALVSPPSL